MGKYPENYAQMADQFGEVIKKHSELGEAARKAGPLSTKNAQLVQLAGAAAVRSEGAVHSHVRRALEAKAKPEEIFHALILLVSTIGFPATAAAMSWAREEIEGFTTGGKKGGGKKGRKAKK